MQYRNYRALQHIYAVVARLLTTVFVVLSAFPCLNFRPQKTIPKQKIATSSTSQGPTHQAAKYRGPHPHRHSRRLDGPSLNIVQLQDPPSSKGLQVVRDYIGSPDSIILIVMTTHLMSILSRGCNTGKTQVHILCTNYLFVLITSQY